MRPVFRSLIAAALVAAAGCEYGPTFPKERFVESLESLLAEEQLDASARLVDHTLAVQLSYAGSLEQVDNQIGVGPNFDEAMRKALGAVHRVIFSSDAQVEFYVLLLSDPGTPGAYLTIVRYMDDVKRASANMIDSPEMSARTIFELNYTGSAPVTIDQYVPRDIRIEEFLSWQLARRIQYALADEMQEGGQLTVGRCGGRYQNGEFVFTLDVSPMVEAGLDEETMRKVFEVSTNTVAAVLGDYRFQSYEAVRLIHPLTGRNLVLPRTRVERFPPVPQPR
jgi:hypothetical protein